LNGFLKDKAFNLLKRVVCFGFLICIFPSLEACGFDKYSSRILIFLGAPGAGKSTIADSLEKEGYIRLSLSDLIRKEIKKENTIFLTYKKQIQSGEGEIPFEIMAPYIEQLIKQALNNKIVKKIIIEGFPRSVKQAEFLDHVLKCNGLENDYEVIYFALPYDVLIERMVYRKVCPICSKIYNLKTKPSKKEGVCDVCQSPLSEKYPITHSIAHKKAQKFFNWSPAVLAFYSKKNRLKVYSPPPF